MSIVVPAVREITSRMIELRRSLHAHPELGFEEFVTQKQVIRYLTEWGYEVHSGLGVTGVVGTLRSGTGKTIGLRADMDALPIQELGKRAWCSQLSGKMHACGHDGHTAMLLAAAYALSVEATFQGTLHLFFQPSEENVNGSGAKRMLEEGLFELFPCDAIFAMHNMPGYPAGKIGMRTGAFMASADEIIIRLTGSGGHGAIPHKAIDPVVVSASLILALQTLVSRSISPLDSAVLTVGSLHAGDVANVIPETAEMCITLRTLNPDVRKMLHTRIPAMANAHAEGFGARAEVTIMEGYPVLVNDAGATEVVHQTLLDWCQEEGIIQNLSPIMGSEDFAFWLEHCPGSYMFIGNGDGKEHCMVHNPEYDFNDEILPIGASFWVKLVERFLAGKK